MCAAQWGSKYRTSQIIIKSILVRLPNGAAFECHINIRLNSPEFKCSHYFYSETIWTSIQMASEYWTHKVQCTLFVSPLSNIQAWFLHPKKMAASVSDHNIWKNRWTKQDVCKKGCRNKQNKTAQPIIQLNNFWLQKVLGSAPICA